MAKALNNAYGSVLDILLNDVPKDLNFMRKGDRVEVAKDMICKAGSDPTLIRRIITGYETLVYEYNTQS